MIEFDKNTQRIKSFVVINDNTAIKLMDKSAFNQGTVIPIERKCRKYFNINHLLVGDEIPVTLIYDNKVYTAKITASKDKRNNELVRLLWVDHFIKLHLPIEYQRFEMNFNKTGRRNEYQVEFTDLKETSIYGNSSYIEETA